jgi:N-carbamoyl-L-amino-acid hydrolase
MSNIPLSPQRLWDSLMAMAAVGATPAGGNNRQALTGKDAEGRRLLLEWGSALGLTPVIDAAGTIGLLRPGRDPARKPVAVGSHLDTVPTGGRFDGAYGVLAGLEILRALHEAGAETEAPILLINWTNEEGARFYPPMGASEVAMGLRPLAELLATQERAGTETFGSALTATGFAGSTDPAVFRDIAAYFETHIEQGPILERENAEVGIVSHALGVMTFTVTIEGRDGHVGSPMEGRADALVAGASLIIAAERIALAHAGLGSVTRLSLFPDTRGNIPSCVTLGASLRGHSQEGIDAMLAEFRAEADLIALARGVTITIAQDWGYPMVPFDAVLKGRLEESADRRGIARRTLPTPIGHDAIHVGRVLPAAMLFIPCHGGLSHNEAESITPRWAEAGLLVLADAVLETAGLVRT